MATLMAGTLLLVARTLSTLAGVVVECWSVVGFAWCGVLSGCAVLRRVRCASKAKGCRQGSRGAPPERISQPIDLAINRPRALSLNRSILQHL